MNHQHGKPVETMGGDARETGGSKASSTSGSCSTDARTLPGGATRGIDCISKFGLDLDSPTFQTNSLCAELERIWYILEPVGHAHVVCAVVARHDHEGVRAVEERLVLESSHSDAVLSGGGSAGDRHIVVTHWIREELRSERGDGGRVRTGRQLIFT